MRRRTSRWVKAVGCLLAAMYGRAGATDAVWQGASHGNWDDATRWSTNPVYPNNGSPNAGDTYDAIVNVVGASYRLTITTDLSLASLTVDSPNVIVSANSGRQTIGALDVKQGIYLGYGGVLAGARVTCTATDKQSLGTIDGITLASDMKASSSNVLNNLTLSEGITVRGSFGFKQGDQVLSGRATLMGGVSATAGSVTIAPEMTIRNREYDSTNPSNETSIGVSGGGRVINKGNVYQDSTQGVGMEFRGSWENQGLIKATGNRYLGLHGTWTNSGIIEQAGAIDGLTLDGTWSNTGTLRASSGALLICGGTVTTDQVGHFETSGTGQIQIYTGTTLDNTGRTLQLGTGRLLTVYLGGTIRGGTITSVDSSPVIMRDGTLDGVTMGADLAVGRVTLAGFSGQTSRNIFLGYTLGQGHIGARLTVPDGTVFSGGGQLVAAYSTSRLATVSGGPVTIGPDFTLRTQNYGSAELGSVINQGTIWVDSPNSTVTITSGLNNQGVIKVTSGTLALAGNVVLDNLGGVIHSGGSIRIDGSLDNTGKSLNLDTQLGSLDLTGTITGGSVSTIGTTKLNVAYISSTFPKLIDVAFSGNLTVTGGADFTLKGSTTLTNTQLKLVTTDVLGPKLRLDINDTNDPFLGTGSITFDSTTSGIGYISAVSGYPGRTAPLTFGPNMVVTTGTGSGGVSFDQIRNQGVMAAVTSGKTLTVTAARTFTNEGTLRARNGGKLVAGPLAGPIGNIDLATGGYLRVNAYSEGADLDRPLTVSGGSTLALSGKWTNSAALTVSGANLHLYGDNAVSGAPISVTSSTLSLMGTVHGALLSRIAYSGASIRLDSSLDQYGQIIGNGYVDNYGNVLEMTAQTGNLFFHHGGIGGGTLRAKDGTYLNATGGASGSLWDVIIESNVTCDMGWGFGLGGQWVNKGTFSVNGHSLNLSKPTDPLLGGRNEGLIDCKAGTTLTVYAMPQNTGTIRVTSGNLRIAGTVTPAELARLTLSNTAISVYGTTGRFDMLGATFNLTSQLGDLKIDNGTLANGTISSTTNVVRSSSGNVDGVALGANAIVNGWVYVANSLTVNAGRRVTLGDAGSYGTLAFLARDRAGGGDQTLGGAGEVVFEVDNGMLRTPYSKATEQPIVNPGVLTIGPGMTVRTGAGGGWIWGSAVINQGTISAQTAGKNIRTDLRALSNYGKINVSAGSMTLFVSDTFVYATPEEPRVLLTVPNYGTVHVDAGATLSVDIRTYHTNNYPPYGGANALGVFSNEYTGRVEGNGTIALLNGPLVNHGRIAPGASNNTAVGTLSITGNYTQAADGALAIKISSANPTAGLDRVVISGNATLDGNVIVGLLGGFVPTLGQEFSFLSAAGTIGGRLTGVRGAQPAPGLGWRLVPSAHAVALRAVNGAAVNAGPQPTAAVLGGAAALGGVDAVFDSVQTAGALGAERTVRSATDPLDDFNCGSFSFAMSGSSTQLWDLTFSGDFSGPVNVSFGYDPSLLVPGQDEQYVSIYHFAQGQWQALPVVSIDTEANIITVRTESFSPFAMGVPEPGISLLLAAASAGLLRRSRRA